MLLSISRNLLLAVPPQYESMSESKKGFNAAAGAKVREISRDADMLQRHPEFRAASGLDVKTRATREELRLLVENYLSGSLHSANEVEIESERTTARHVEVMIGRGSWILRAHDEQELLEINFTGVYFNLAYHEDKYVC